MKIIFDANPLARNKTGVGHFTEQMILALSTQLGPQVKFTGYYTAPRGLDLNDNYLDYPNLEFRRIGGISARVLSVLRRVNVQPPIDLLLRTKSDVALFTNYVSMPLLFGGKSISFIYDLSFIDCPEFVAKRNREYLKKWVGKTIGKAGTVLTISNFVKERIVEEYGLADKKIFVTHIPPKPKPKPDGSILKDLLLPDDYLLFVGTIEPRKNITNLVLGYAELPQNIRNKYPLVLAGGDGWLDSEINDTLRSLEKNGITTIRKTGYISEAKLAALYSNCKLVVQPSHYEGFGMPILEAMSYGKPVACSDIEVFKEVSRGAAFLFDKDNPTNISNTLRDVLSHPEKLKAGSLSGKKIYGLYEDWNTVAGKFLEFMNKN